MRFLVYMKLAIEVAVWLRAQGHDAVHLRELGLQELGDKAVLAKAIAESAWF
jgi:predicted nuclease of predicted toxin-antitoxin system